MHAYAPVAHVHGHTGKYTGIDVDVHVERQWSGLALMLDTQAGRCTDMHV